MKNEKLWISWNENKKHSYEHMFKIETEEDFVNAIEQSENVRYFGTKQSSSDISAGTDALIDIREYNKIVYTDYYAMEVTVQSGIKLSEFLNYLEKLNWTLPCLPDINTITVGGALATGTHGTSGKLLASYMVNCRLILADGKIIEVNESDELMDALRVSLGLLGAFSTITFRCTENYTLHITESSENDKVWLKSLEEQIKFFDFYRILWIPHTDSGYVIRGKKISKEIKINENLGPSYLSKRRKISKLLYKFSDYQPWTVFYANKILKQLFFSSNKEYKGSLYQATVTKSRGSTLELAEWSIKRDKFSKLFLELKTTINSFKNKAFIHIPMDVRFVDSDSSWLSNAYGYDVVTLGCVTRNAKTADDYAAFEVVEKLFLKYGGRPHWGKRFDAGDLEFQKLYPKWNEFKLLRSRMDPTNKFMNEYLRKIFSPSL
ncbi:MAG: D-arabinono-1,4-lactone oxidase [Psychroserpens sp.]|uniref:D-arabinono-1,4-lactone oxidase n=1 Tax=Psychroserpens sp. TaxID=2020870 RepID=UPI003C748392